MKNIGIYPRILLLLALTGLFFMLLLSALYFITNKQEKLMVSESGIQFEKEIHSILAIKTTTVRQVVYDYTYWNEFVDHLKIKDPVWYDKNITTILKTYHVDYACVYDTAFNLLHEVASEEIGSRRFISNEILVKLKQTRFLNFFLETPDGVLEIGGASVHDDTDPTHMLTRPSGYLFLAKNWNHDFLQELTILSGARIVFLKASDSVAGNDPNALFTQQPLLGWDDRITARIAFTRTSSLFLLYHQMSQLMLLLVFGIILTTLMVFHFASRRWINKPLKLVTRILKSEKFSDVDALVKSHGEFKLIGSLFADFIRQKDELRIAKEIALDNEKSKSGILELLNEAQTIAKIGSLDWNLLTGTVWWSEELYRIFELNPADYTPSVASNAKFAHPDDSEDFHKTAFKAIETGELIDYRIRIITAKGNLKSCRFIAKVHFSQDKKPVRMNGTFSDISQQVQIMDDLHKAKVKAEESDKLKSAFLANMSHEIRTPMNGILGFSSLLSDPDVSGEEQQQYIQLIQKSGNRLLNIINDIVDIAKIEAGQMEVSYSELDLNAKTDYVYNFFKPEADRKGIRLFAETALTSEEALLFSDPDKILAILINLVNNAFKFTHTGYVKFGCKRSGDFIEFFVEDTGEGIRDEKKEIIFERFMQGDKVITRNYEGTGLGLSISKAYTEMLGGKMWVESEFGKGSTFYFTIRYTPGTQKQPVSKGLVIETGSRHSYTKLRILIAEDDETSKEFINKVVVDFSVEVFQATSGDEAVEICRNHPELDLVLMDIRMPEMDGYEATRRIREFNKEVVIIAQTAFALTGDKEKALEAGCNDYIAKPVSRNTLFEIMDKYF